MQPTKLTLNGEPRLLLLTPSRGFGGGIERVADAIERAWPDEVERVDLYRCGRVRDPSGDPIAKAGFAARALAASARNAPDVVFANHVGLLPVAFAAARPRRAAVRSLGIGVDVWHEMARVERLLVRRSRPLAISSYTAEQLAERAGMRAQQIPVLALAVEPEFADAARSGSAATSGRPFTLLTVSRLWADHRYKGHFDVVAALPAIRAELPDVRWIVVGGGDDAKALRARCRALGVEDAVELRGPVDGAGLMRAYRDADVLVLPSIADARAVPPVGEGFGLVYAEAACFGLPSIASTQGGGALDFVEHERTGLLAPPAAPDALARAVLRLAGEPGLRERLGRVARERVLARHLPEHFAARLRELLIPAG